MTPQLQQAIRLLQLSTLDLQQEIQETLEANPMLEAGEDNDDQGNSEAAEANNLDASSEADSAPTRDNEKDATATSDDAIAAPAESVDEMAAADDTDWGENIPEDLPVDSQWDDVYQSTSATSLAAPSDDLPGFESSTSASESIQDHLFWQLNLTPMSKLDRVIAYNIIDSVQLDGYLDADVETLLATINRQLEETGFEEHVEADEIEAVLRRLQNFDPVGVCARDLAECLLIQLNQLGADTPWLKEAKLIVEDYLPLLGTRDFNQLMRRTKLKDQGLQQTIALIQSLNPKPGETIDTTETEYVIPDVIVDQQNGTWRVRLNPEVMPKVRINSTYASMVKRADTSNDNTYMRNHLQEARWFLKSLQSRNETLLKVASEIVEIQRGFLEYGDEAMRPLVLHDIAEAVEMHESTISRVTTQKYMHTPRGIFELKYFFSSHVETDGGGGCSSTAIRAIIKKLVASENTINPLSDSKIANILADQGIKVARRTIAKYRESMGIPPSNERKQLV